MTKSLDNIFTNKISNFFSSLNNISLECLTPDYGIICIYVAIAIIGIVALSDLIKNMKIENYLDSEEDFERRNRKIPINLVYTYVTRNYAGAIPVPFIIDLNDPTGLRMKTIFDRRELKVEGNLCGFPCKNKTVDNLGILRANAEALQLKALEAANNGVKSGGLPIQTIPGTSQYICQILVLRAA